MVRRSYGIYSRIYRVTCAIYRVICFPDPNAAEHDAGLEEWVKHFLEQSQGRAFVLFTSYKLMENLALRMERWFQQKGWELLEQGKGRHQVSQSMHQSRKMLK